MKAAKCLQRGFSLVSAIFLLVVLTTLGAAILTFSSVQQTTSAQDVQGSRAYQAARAGIEYGLYQVLRMGGTANCGTMATPALTGTLAGFAITVAYTCTADFTEGGSTFKVVTITSTASSGVAGSTTYVERQLTASVAR